MTPTLNPHFYQLVLPPEVIINKVFPSLEFVTLLTYRKKEQSFMQEALAYSKAAMINDEPINFENFDNLKRKYKEKENYVLK